MTDTCHLCSLQATWWTLTLKKGFCDDCLAKYHPKDRALPTTFAASARESNEKAKKKARQ